VPSVSLASTLSLSITRSRSKFAASETNHLPGAVPTTGAVAFAAALSFRLSRTDAFHWLAFSAVFATAVSGVVQAMISPP
jgi:hypothetical protein